MKEKRFSLIEMMNNPMIQKCLENETFRLLGINWKEKVEWFQDPCTGDIVVRYE